MKISNPSMNRLTKNLLHYLFYNKNLCLYVIYQMYFIFFSLNLEIHLYMVARYFNDGSKYKW